MKLILSLFPDLSKAKKAKEPKSFDYGAAAVGTERWITITDDTSPLHGRHILIKKKAGGTWGIIAGGGMNAKRKHLEHIELDMEKKKKTAKIRQEQREKKRELSKEARQLRKEKRAISQEKREKLSKVVARKGVKKELGEKEKKLFIAKKKWEFKKLGVAPEEMKGKIAEAVRRKNQQIKREHNKAIRKLDKQLDIMLQAHATGEDFITTAKKTGKLDEFKQEPEPKKFVINDEAVSKLDKKSRDNLKAEARKPDSLVGHSLTEDEVKSLPQDVQKVYKEEPKPEIKTVDEKPLKPEGEQDNLKLNDDGEPIPKEKITRDLTDEQREELRQRMLEIRRRKEMGESMGKEQGMPGFNVLESGDQAIENNDLSYKGTARFRDGENTQLYEKGDPGQVDENMAAKHDLMTMRMEEALSLKSHIEAHNDRLREIRKIDKRLKQVETKGAKVLDSLSGLEHVEISPDELLHRASKKFMSNKAIEDNRRLYDEINFAILGKTEGEEFRKKGIHTDPRMEKNIQQGAFEALNGVQVEVFGGTGIKKEVMQGLGIQGSTAVLAHLIMSGKTPGELKNIKEGLDKYIEKQHPQLVQDVLKKADHYDAVIKDLEEKRGVKEKLTDPSGKVVAEAALITGTAINRKQNEARVQKNLHLGTAMGSLQTIATLKHILDSGFKNGTIDMNVGKERKNVTQAIRGLGLKLKEKGVKYNVRKTDVGYKISVPVDSLKNYTKAVQREQARMDHLRAVKEGKTDKKGWLPDRFNKKITVVVDGKKKIVPLDMSKDPKYRHQQTAIRSSLAAMDKDKGGGMLHNIEVGGGKTAVSFGVFSELEKRDGKKLNKYYACPNKTAKQALDELHNFTKMKGKIVTNVKDLKNPKIDVKIITHDFYAKNVDAINAAGFEAGAVDEYDQLPEHTRTKTRRDKNLKYRLALTGTPVGNKGVMDTYAIMQYVSNKSKELGTTKEFRDKYNTIATGTTGWENSVVEGLKEHVSPFIYSSESKHDFKNKISEVKSNMTKKQKLKVIELNSRKREDRKALNLKAEKEEWSAKQRKAALDKIEQDYDALQERAILSGDAKHNGRFQALKQQIDQRFSKSKQGKKHKFIIHVSDGEARKSVVRNLEKTYGAGTVADMAEKAATKEEKQKIADKHLKNFRDKADVKFLVIDRDSTAGVNAQRADTAIFYQTPKTARDKIQATGRHARTGREKYGDAETVFMSDAENPIDSQRMSNMKREETLLEAIAGKGGAPRNIKWGGKAKPIAEEPKPVLAMKKKKEVKPVLAIKRRKAA